MNNTFFMLGQINNTFFLFGREIHYYGLILTFGMLCALVLFYFLAKRYHIESDFVLSMFIFAVVFAIVGARLFYVVPRPEFWQWNSFDDFLKLFELEGLTIIGGIPMGALGIYICCRIYKKSFFRVADLVVPALLLGQVIGRWGNFVNGELYGMKITNDAFKFFPMGVNIGGTWHYANFFYEMVLNAIALIVVLILILKFKEKLKCGAVTICYIIWYGIVRGILEFIKIDQLTWNGIRVIQMICFICAGIGIIFLILLQLGIIKLETRKMYNLHFRLLEHEPPEYGDNPEISNIELITDVADINADAPVSRKQIKQSNIKKKNNDGDNNEQE